MAKVRIVDLEEKIKRTAELMIKIDECLENGEVPSFDKELYELYFTLPYRYKRKYMGFIPWKKLIDKKEEDFEDTIESREDCLRDIISVIFFEEFDGSDKNVAEARIYMIQKMMDGVIPYKYGITRHVIASALETELSLICKDRESVEKIIKEKRKETK